MPTRRPVSLSKEPDFLICSSACRACGSRETEAKLNAKIGNVLYCSNILNARSEPMAGLHICCGLNECRGQGKNGTGTMPGDGQCATVQHHCVGANDCAGLGGCGLGDAATQSTPGVNGCNGQGGCGSPLGNKKDPPAPPDTSKICTYPNTAGPNSGHAVWQLARKLFEEKMKKQGKQVGKSPCCQD